MTKEKTRKKTYTGKEGKKECLEGQGAKKWGDGEDTGQRKGHMVFNNITKKERGICEMPGAIEKRKKKRNNTKKRTDHFI